MDYELQVYNSLKNKKEIFKEINPGKIGIYVCGPTVYSSSHMGHARSAIVFDSIVRFLRFIGYETTYVRNFTDVDDKIINRANEEGVSVESIANKYKSEYVDDMVDLGCIDPNFQPCVSENIQEIIELIEKIITTGHAYVANSEVYYDINKFSDYGKLSNQSTDLMLSNSRLELNPNKKNDLDFALWKSSKKDEPSWESPWGPGRPGWHIECSCMSMKYLGETFDFHGGGRDLIFPHHENEIAQSECVTKKKFANYWLHNGLININNEKMSKSVGNIINIRDALKIWNKDIVRVFFLTHHYRTPVDLSNEKLKEIEKTLLKINKNLETKNNNSTSNSCNDFKKLWINAMLDDFNTAKAFGYYFKYINEGLLSLKDNEFIEEFEKTMGIFGWRNQFVENQTSTIKPNEEEIALLIADRNRARNEKDWEKADELRLEAEKLGIKLIDSKDGTSWEEIN
ncbi:MAG: cysteine--tRNA ligase [Thermodesulfobacteriota bacterium]|nr:cysteine--tRNA ligase [Thermodesulfobacteriota bacterium]